MGELGYSLDCEADNTSHIAFRAALILATVIDFQGRCDSRKARANCGVMRSHVPFSDRAGDADPPWRNSFLRSGKLADPAFDKPQINPRCLSPDKFGSRRRQMISENSTSNFTRRVGQHFQQAVLKINATKENFGNYCYVTVNSLQGSRESTGDGIARNTSRHAYRHEGAVDN